MKKFDVVKVLQRLGLHWKTDLNPNELILNCIDKFCPQPVNHLYLNKRTGLFICHRCGVTGNLVTFVSHVNDVDPMTARMFILDKDFVEPVDISDLREQLDEIMTTPFGIELSKLKTIIKPPPDTTPVTFSEYPKYLKTRRIPAHLAMRVNSLMCYKGRYADRIIFPFRCKGNQSFVAYSIDASIQPKTLNPPGNENHRLLYLYDEMERSRGPKDTLIVVEGIFDCLRCLCYDFPSVALLKSHISVDQAILLNQSSFKKIVIMLDGDMNPTLGFGKNLGSFIRKTASLAFCVDKPVFFALIPDYHRDPDTLAKAEIQKYVKDARPFSENTTLLFRLQTL